MAATETLRLEFLRDLDAQQRESTETALKRVRLNDAQRDFAQSAEHQLDLTRENPSRDTFAVRRTTDGADDVVGIGTLHVEDTPGHQWPMGTLVFRGFVIDIDWQGSGLGSLATELVLDAAAARFPEHDSVVLAVHNDNVAGQRAYTKRGFAIEGDAFIGRAGAPHFVMRAQLADRRK